MKLLTTRVWPFLLAGVVLAVLGFTVFDGVIAGIVVALGFVALLTAIVRAWSDDADRSVVKGWGGLWG